MFISYDAIELVIGFGNKFRRKSIFVQVKNEMKEKEKVFRDCRFIQYRYFHKSKLGVVLATSARVILWLFVFCLILLCRYSVAAIKASETACLPVPGFFAVVYLAGVVSGGVAPRGSASVTRPEMGRSPAALATPPRARPRHHR